jgi:hypothetical protein
MYEGVHLNNRDDIDNTLLRSTYVNDYFRYLT